MINGRAQQYLVDMQESISVVLAEA